ncbi:MAG: glycoside hydrolase family 31 protein [Brevinematales bacterium]|nr:glycoside hydrolase family 31 protein [Brevinematales bacterium]
MEINFKDEKLKCEVFSERVVRFHFSKNGEFKSESFIIDENVNGKPADFKKDKDKLFFTTDLLKVYISEEGIEIFNEDGLILSDVEKKGYLKDGKKISSIKKILDIQGFYGFGMRRGKLNKKGEFLINWNTDDPNHFFETDPLYQCHPFFIALSETYCYGIYFDNYSRSYFDFRGNEFFSFEALDGELDYYFIYGENPSIVLEEFTKLVGRAYLPPIWALGYQQSRWSYKSEKEVKRIAKSFRKRKIPCDVIYLDIDYMDNYKVFTINNKKFKNFQKMAEDLKKLGFKIVTIIDPGVKIEKGYKIFDEGSENNYFCKRENELATGYVWPGKCAFPDFTDENVREWWGKNHKFLIDNGVSGIWNDMNEPAIMNKTDYNLMNLIFKFLGFNYPPAIDKTTSFTDKIKKILTKTLPDDTIHKKGTHLLFHNIYGYLMCKATYEGLKRLNQDKRPFILTRSGFSGIQKYSAVWGGDNQSTWKHLEMSIISIQNLSNSGVPFVGEDIGGFWKSLRSGELFVRWIELGVFYPFMRVHSALNTKRQEPWSFGEKYENIIVDYIKLRYKLLPYIYSCFYEAKERGIPIIRSMFLEFFEDKNTHTIEDQFMFGPNILVAPIYRMGIDRRGVYLPRGKWVDFWSGEQIDGGKYIEAKAPIEKIPLFVRNIIPMGEVENYVDEKKKETLYVNVYSENAEFIYYEDDGLTFDYEKGVFNLIKLIVKNGKPAYEYIHKGYNGVNKLIFIFKDREETLVI